MKTLYEGPAFRITQRNRNFYYFPVPSRVATSSLGYSALHWDPMVSAFSGFNRRLNADHVADIVAGLKVDGAVIPNSIITYILHDNFKFTPNPSEKAPIEFGQASIFVDDSAEDSKVGF